MHNLMVGQYRRAVTRRKSGERNVLQSSFGGNGKTLAAQRGADRIKEHAAKQAGSAGFLASAEVEPRGACRGFNLCARRKLTCHNGIPGNGPNIAAVFA